MNLERVTRRWWTLVVRGLLAIGFGVATIAVPRTAVLALVLVFGIYAVVDGVAALHAAIMRRGAEGAWLLGLGGVLSVGAGVMALLWPGITAVALFFLIASWAVALGVVELISAIVYSREVEGEWAVVISGLLWIGFGVLLLVWPGLGALAVLALIATSAVLRGFTLIVAGVQVRRLDRRLAARSSEPPRAMT